jgi:hypothetical protein
MSEPRYPGAQWIPGRNAGYNAGHSNMHAAICHFTVGVNSTGIGRDGYFHWLVARDGRIQQFAEADAVTWHAGEANRVGPGIEIEHLPGVDDDVFTDAARDATSGLIHWLRDEWGIPLDYWDGDRIPPSSMRGFVAHRSVEQSERHADYWPRADWDRMVSGTPPAPPSEEDRMQPEFMANRDGVVYVYDANTHTKTRVGDPDAYYAIAAVWSLHGVGTNIASNDTTEIILRDAVEIHG